MARIIFLPLLLFALSTSSQPAVLSSGSWYHFVTQQDGVHQLTYDELLQLGVLSSSVTTQSIRMYSNGPGMLPEENWIPRPDDLLEIPIAVFDGNDGAFGPGDYFLFYGTDQVMWKYHAAENRFSHQNNLYDDKTHFFLTFNEGNALRINTASYDSLSVTFEANTFTDRQIHEQELFNIHHSGKKWYGEDFQSTPSRSFTFQFPNMVSGQEASCVIDLVSRCYGAGNTNGFTLSTSGESLNFEVENISGNYLIDLVKPANKTLIFTPQSDEITVTVDYVPHDLYSAAWLNYITIQAERELRASPESQLHFRQPQALQTGATTYSIANFQPDFMVWEVTDFHQPKKINGALSENHFHFTSPNNVLREFVCFSPNSLLTPQFEGNVPNQNLKGQPPAQGFIVSHPDFLSQAMQLAAFHESHDGLSVNVATTDQIYREFSGGAKDITAIKDYLRFFYDQAGFTGVSPKYLCIIGDASFDYKGNMYPGADFVPTFESETSFGIINSYGADDYFGLLDFSDSNELTDGLDLGIGRIPAKSVQEAQSIIDKIMNYTLPEMAGEWQYNVMFSADDEDNNLHMSQANSLAENLLQNHCPIQMHKIYFDAFEQISLPEGDRYPDATAAIIDHINKGMLVCNYTGHSGYANWAAEQVLTASHIDNLDNDYLPLFFMANCEFSRFDAPHYVSGGELLLSNPQGGAIACISNSRPAYSSTNYAINTKFYQQLFARENGEYLRLGDIVRNAKNTSIHSSTTAHRSINLLGDPMLRLRYPELNMEIIDVSGAEFINNSYEINPNTPVSFTGNVTDFFGEFQTGFNGEMSYLVLDSKIPQITLSNDNFEPFSYTARTDTVAWGTAAVSNGVFDFTIANWQNGNDFLGNGKMLLFATDGSVSASGCFTEIQMVSSLTSIQNNRALQAVFYPNPVQEKLNISLSGNTLPVQLEIYDDAGRVLHQSKRSPSETIEISMHDYVPGTYLIRISTENGSVVARVIMQN